MIPPANMIQDESGGNEEDHDQIETPKAPTTDSSQQETKVRLSVLLLFTITTIPRDRQIYCGISISPSLINRAGQTNFFQQDNKTDSTGS